MGLRFFRRFTLFPGLTINWSLSGPSVSIGPRGAKFTFGPRGTRATVGLPGTGLFYTQATSRRKSAGQAARQAAAPEDTLEDRLEVGKLKGAFMPAEEKNFRAGYLACVEGRVKEAIDLLRKGGRRADTLFCLGIMLYRDGQDQQASEALKAALSRSAQLGASFKELGLDMSCSLSVTEHVVVDIMPRPRGVQLLLAESLQRCGRRREAADVLGDLQRKLPDDQVVRLALADVLLDLEPNGKMTAKRVVKLAGDYPNETEVNTCLLLMKGIALGTLGLHEAAVQTFTLALRRRKHRAPELLHEIRYRRGLAHLELGSKAGARKDFERLYAAAPDFKDVAGRLGL